MIRLYDSIRVDALRRVASTSNAAVAGYVDGHWPDFRAVVAAFPLDHHLSIAAHPDDDADCLDVETGDAIPADAPTWALRQHRRGVWRPVLYASLSVWPKIEDELRKVGLPGVFVRRWYAEWNNQEVIAQGFDGHQFTDRAAGQNVDESVLLDDFFGHPHQLARARVVTEVELNLGSLHWRPIGSHVEPAPWGD